MSTTARRYFRVTVPKGSLLDFFKRGSNPTEVVKPHYKKSTDQLIEKIEHNQGELLTSSKSTFIPIIGKESLSDSVSGKELNGFQINRWIPRRSIYSKKLAASSQYQTAVNIILDSTYTHVTGRSVDDSAELSDIQERFKLIKKVQINFGLIISDIELTRTHTLGQLRNLLLQKLDPSLKVVDEQLPNAIYVDPTAYMTTNVSVGEFLGSKQKEVKFNELLKSVQRVEKGATIGRT
ncbi:BA75_01105T0 [Komagataella pastoris]|uniref:Large ribosomal subunit protein mL50 n=1 Tax=Komagataella pastoris TaxID=4922 RepID=A0A1B2J602_PICPA|nr:BA75_01105T0 [Komagataella pastoris]